MRLIGLLICSLLLITCQAPDPATQRVFSGTFTSDFQDGPLPVRAVFTPTGDAAFKVSFFFKFDGVDHEYKGRAQGTLGKGTLSGDVRSDGRKRTFVFEGVFSDQGVFDGKHTETTRGANTETGTLTMERAAPDVG